MTLYVPGTFAVDDTQALYALIDEHPFATLVTPGSPEPHVSHIPLLRVGAQLFGHFAGANAHAGVVEGVESLAIFHGPHAYVSPTWYVDPANAVPTWNLATAHVHGRIEVLRGTADAERVVGYLVARFEGEGPTSWRFSMQGRAREALLRNIVAFRMPIERIAGKFKLSQNRPVEDRRRVIAALGASAHADARATAAWMRRHADPDAQG
jgi:transcriptional regulator